LRATITFGRATSCRADKSGYPKNKSIVFRGKLKGATVKKLINAPKDLVGEYLDGLVLANAKLLEMGQGRQFVRRRATPKHKVALLSGGGSGHEPLHAGFVGYGMLDAACPGPVFTSPTPGQIIAATQAITGDQGCLFIVKNYAGDLMNFEMASEMLDLTVQTIVVADDVVTRRGIAGTLLIEKLLGAAAEEGADLIRLQAFGRQLNECTRSMGMALTAGVMPTSATSTFNLGDDEMEMGVGIHGEPGRWRSTVADAGEIVATLLALRAVGE
jgi:dihydroxyacetone kinase-like protein